MKQFVALIRGINVGGKKQIKMSELKKIFEDLGYKKVETVLATGNVIFETDLEDLDVLKSQTELALEKVFDSRTLVTLRTLDSIKDLVSTNPFVDTTVGVQTRLYISFLPQPIDSTLYLSSDTNQENMSVVLNTGSEICSVVQLTKYFGTTDAMIILEKEYSKNITTRNWKTVLKIMDVI